MNHKEFMSKYPDVVSDGYIQLILVAQKLRELPYLIRDGLYEESKLEEFKYDFNMLDIQNKRDKLLKELLG